MVSHALTPRSLSHSDWPNVASGEGGIFCSRFVEIVLVQLYVGHKLILYKGP